MTKPSKRSHPKISRLFDDGFSIQELSIMYTTTPFQIEQVLDCPHCKTIDWSEL